MFLKGTRRGYIGVEENVGLHLLTGGLRTKNTVAPFKLCRPANIQEEEFYSALTDGVYYWIHTANESRSAHLYPRHLCIPRERGGLGGGLGGGRGEAR